MMFDPSCNFDHVWIFLRLKLTLATILSPSSFSFRLMELLVVNAQEFAGERLRLTQYMRDSLDLLIKAGNDRVGVETFQEMMVELFEDDLVNRLHTQKDVENLFANKGESEHIVWYGRALCAAYMKINAERFFPFLPPGGKWTTVEQYCAREVEPQGKECEDLHILALCETMGVRVIIEYLSAATTDAKTAANSLVKFGPEDAKIKIKLLYRPGHYDLLY